MTNQELISRFLTYLRIERGMSENTIESYETDLTKFAAWLAVPLNTANRTNLQKYVADVLAEGISGSTAARYLACLRCFFRFLVDEGDIAHDPTRNLPVPKTWKRVPKFISESDLDEMVNSLGPRQLDIRDRAMLLLLFGCGLRVTELVNLKLQDLSLDDGVVKIWNGKGGKDAVLPMSPRSVEALRTYLEKARRSTAEPFVFVGRMGLQLSRQQVFLRVQKLSSGTLGKKVGVHALRHGFATALVEGGADIRDVQALMRHSDVETTSIYVHMDLNFLRRKYNASHPRAILPATQN